MKILYYFTDFGTHMEKWQYFHVIDALEKNGHEVLVFNPVVFKKSLKEEISALKKNLQAVDVFLTCSGVNELKYDHLNLLNQNNKISKILICFDNLQDPYLHLPIVKHFDLVWLTSKENIDLFRKYEVKKLIFMPYAARVLNNNELSSKITSNVVFVGTPYGQRIQFLNKLNQNNLDVSVYSNKLLINKQLPDSVSLFNFKKLTDVLRISRYSIGRKLLISSFISRLQKKENISSQLNVLPSIDFDEMYTIYSESLLSLNFLDIGNTSLLQKPVYKIHLRCFEIPAAGGVQVVKKNLELSEYFENWEEIIFFDSLTDVIDIHNELSKNNSLVAKIKKKAKERVQEQHTWEFRFKKLFEEIC
jgi:spore maturation protein CgeB